MFLHLFSLHKRLKVHTTWRVKFIKYGVFGPLFIGKMDKIAVDYFIDKKKAYHGKFDTKLTFTAMRILERLGYRLHHHLSKFGSYVCICEFTANFLYFWVFIRLGFLSRNYWS